MNKSNISNVNNIEIKSAKKISFYTSISRILGYFRSLVLAFEFGTGIIADAFFIAFRLPNTLRKLLGEGAISSAFIPVFNDLLINKDRDEAFKFANKLFSCLGIIVAILTLCIYFLAPYILKVLAPGFVSSPEKTEIAIVLIQYLFPYLLFMTLCAVAMGILNSLKHFTIPAFSPILFNVCFIGSLLFISSYLNKPILGIIVGVLGGGLLQLIVHILALKRFNFKFSFDLDYNNPMVRKVARLIIPTIFSLAITEINFFVNNIIASYESIAGKGAISVLFYANFLVQLPLAIISTSIATAFFPGMSESVVRENHHEVKQSFTNALKVSFFVILPACVGLIILAYPITRLLFQHGEFTENSTIQTAKALIAYSAGLLAFSGVKITVPVFYSMYDTKTPLKIGAVSVVINIILSIALAYKWGHVGLAMAASIAAFINFGLLFFYLERKLGSFNRKRVINSLSKIMTISLIMGAVVKYVFDLFEIFFSQTSTIMQITSLGVSIFSGISVYFGLAYLMKREELFWLLNRNKP